MSWIDRYILAHRKCYCYKFVMCNLGAFNSSFKQNKRRDVGQEKRVNGPNLAKIQQKLTVQQILKWALNKNKPSEIVLLLERIVTSSCSEICGSSSSHLIHCLIFVFDLFLLSHLSLHLFVQTFHMTLSMK